MKKMTMASLLFMGLNAFGSTHMMTANALADVVGETFLEKGSTFVGSTEDNRSECEVKTRFTRSGFVVSFKGVQPAPEEILFSSMTKHSVSETNSEDGSYVITATNKDHTAVLRIQNADDAFQVIEVNNNVCGQWF